MSYWSPKKQPVVDLMPLIAMQRFHKEPKKSFGLIATLIVSNIVCVSAVCLLLGMTWTSTKMSVWITEFYAKERNRWAQIQTQKDLQLENLNIQIARLVGMQTSSPADILQLAKKISSILDTASGTQRQFLEQVMPEAIRIQVQYGIPASVTISQAIYESRYGQSALAVQAHNYFGMKAFAESWKGDSINMPTKDNGIATRANFRVYRDMAAGFQGYADFLKEGDRYKSAFYTKSGKDFLARILAAGYCEEASYAPTIKIIMQRHNLEELDDLLKQGANAPYQVALNKKSSDDDGSDKAN
ncbi:MAG: glucosaminidase domain-containing protein [Verrucomicrobiales bacterium]|jgi:flagellum-specific peptidoglycan hydrolase FlgJ|nr:glucosaminidase domain-containing protein [Verrucomicrobiales bacterium]